MREMYMQSSTLNTLYTFCSEAEEIKKRLYLIIIKKNVDEVCLQS